MLSKNEATPKYYTTFVGFGRFIFLRVGVTLLKGGAFTIPEGCRQVLPVMPHTSREDIVSHSLRAHPLWLSGSVRALPLGQNMRAAKEKPWRDFLLQLGDGNFLIEESVSPFAVRLPDEIVAPQDWAVPDMINHAFPRLLHAAARVVASDRTLEVISYFCDRSILTPLNKNVDVVNREIIAAFPKESITTYFSSDSVDAGTAEDRALWPTDFVHSLTPVECRRTNWR